ncbi:ras-related and estrogen-regulated growth inhibitor [Ciona intestinalis]
MFRSTTTNHIRLMVVGQEGVGKSALIVKYLTGRFISEYQSDFDWKYSYQTNIEGEQVHMEIIDSLTIDDTHIVWAEGFMMVYDVTNQDSLLKIEQIKERLDSVRSTKILTMIMVANKTDMEHCRTVGREQADALAARLSCGHVECSACGPEAEVRFAFDELCREVALARQQSAKKRERRRSSLSQVRQGLKMLVQTGKAKSHAYTTTSPNGTNASTNGGGMLRRGSRFGPPSPFSALMSAPILNDLPENESDHDSSVLSRLMECNSTANHQKERESSSDGKEEENKQNNYYKHNNYGALVL